MDGLEHRRQALLDQEGPVVGGGAFNRAWRWWWRKRGRAAERSASKTVCFSFVESCYLRVVFHCAERARRQRAFQGEKTRRIERSSRGALPPSYHSPLAKSTSSSSCRPAHYSTPPARPLQAVPGSCLTGLIEFCAHLMDLLPVVRPAFLLSPSSYPRTNNSRATLATRLKATGPSPASPPSLSLKIPASTHRVSLPPQE